MSAGLLGFGAVGRAEAVAIPATGAGPFAKFMAKQDVLAVGAAAKALAQAGLTADELATETGLYVTTCRLGFEDDELAKLLERSAPDGRFDVGAFSTKAFFGMRPTQTFKCLSYMPLFHVARSFGLHGRYFTNYPDAGQFLVALRQALLDLDAGCVRFALVGAVADRENALARAMEARLGGAGDGEDAGAFVVLGPAADGRAFARCAMPRLAWRGSPDAPVPDGVHGCVAPLLALGSALAGGGPLRYAVAAAGIDAEWEVAR